MKKFQFTIIMEGLLDKGVKSAEIIGDTDADNIKNAAKQTVQFGENMNGKFTKCTLILKEVTT
jgi:hypothetical protein